MRSEINALIIFVVASFIVEGLVGYGLEKNSIPFLWAMREGYVHDADGNNEESGRTVGEKGNQMMEHGSSIMQMMP